MILTGKNIGVERVETSKNKAEVIKVVIKSSLGIERSYMGVYVPPKTSAWGGLSTRLCWMILKVSWRS